MKIGIPRSLYYYHYKDLWLSFFKRLGIEVVISEKTNKKIMEKGIQLSNEEMCISLKNYLGHVASLKGKCDYVLIPRINNYSVNHQTCNNYLNTYDIVYNLLDIPILHYNISITDGYSEEKEFLKWSSILKKSKKEIKKAYRLALEESICIQKSLEDKNKKKLKSKKTKILIVSHPYNIFDSYIGGNLIKTLKNSNIEIIHSEYFHHTKSNILGNQICNGLYFKYAKEEVKSILMCENKVDGIIFLTAFPCALDSLVIPLALRKINIPYINLIIEEENNFINLITSLENFVDNIKKNKIHEKYL